VVKDGQEVRERGEALHGASRRAGRGGEKRGDGNARRFLKRLRQRGPVGRGEGEGGLSQARPRGGGEGGPVGDQDPLAVGAGGTATPSMRQGSSGGPVGGEAGEWGADLWALQHSTGWQRQFDSNSKFK
jgi:hypothetical protein